MRAPALLLLSCALALPARAADDPAGWQPWIEDADAAVTTPEPVFPEAAALAKLRGNRDWLERWAAPPPSLSWSDVVSSLVVKYQQNPLRAQRNHTYAQVAIHDGSFGEAHPQRPYGNLY